MNTIENIGFFTHGGVQQPICGKILVESVENRKDIGFKLLQILSVDVVKAFT